MDYIHDNKFFDPIGSPHPDECCCDDCHENHIEVGRAKFFRQCDRCRDDMERMWAGGLADTWEDLGYKSLEEYLGEE